MVIASIIIGKPYGYGKYFMSDSSSYYGQFLDGSKHGFGKWRGSKYSTNTLYEGQYANNMKHGFGIYKWPTGSIYIGQYANDKREGIGEMIWPDGLIYIGQWKDDIQNGYGKMYFPDGRIKEGVFIKNVFKDSKLPNVPKELLNKSFNIMKYADKNLDFSPSVIAEINSKMANNVNAQMKMR